jgi:hypothetical protein
MIGRRALYTLTAVVGWAALALQLALIIFKLTSEGASVAFAVWRFLGFFTILTNLAVAVVASAMAWWPNSTLAGPRARLMTATAIVLVGVIYSVALRSVWHPQGWQAVADHALHDATPPLFALCWIMSDHGLLRWRDALWAMVPPILYCLYAFVRGSLDGWYAYWFLNSALPIGQLSLNIATKSVGFFVVALIFVEFDRMMSRKSVLRERQIG